MIGKRQVSAGDRGHNPRQRNQRQCPARVAQTPRVDRTASFLERFFSTGPGWRIERVLDSRCGEKDVGVGVNSGDEALRRGGWRVRWTGQRRFSSGSSVPDQVGALKGLWISTAVRIADGHGWATYWYENGNDAGWGLMAMTRHCGVSRTAPAGPGVVATQTARLPAAGQRSEVSVKVPKCLIHLLASRRIHQLPECTTLHRSPVIHSS